MYIFAIGFLTLFLELVFIRWFPANMFVLAYFSNTVLLAAFLGLGLGHLLTWKRGDYFKYFLVCLLIVVVGSYFARLIFVYMALPTGDLIWNFFYINNWMKSLPVRMHILPALGMAYVFITIPFIFIGHKTSQLMQGVPALQAYAWHVSGSVFGIIAFGLVNTWARGWEMPFVWFTIVCFVWGIFYVFKQGHARVIGFICGLSIILFLLVVAGPKNNNNWSPYYDISVVKEANGELYNVFVNRFLHQSILNFEINEYARVHYDLPYQLVSPKQVLVLGAGNGNDVASALRNGALRVDAVELDPVLASVGIQTHPNQPYQDQRVRLTIGDARNFLTKNSEKYDFIIIGTLDSHALLSGVSTVRVENYLYTREAFELIKSHLTPDGVMVLQFSAPKQWLADKIFKTATEVFSDPTPLLYHGTDDFLYNILVMAGPGVQNVIDTQGVPPSFVQADPDSYTKIAATTDNWPYLYLRSRSLPRHYLMAIGLILAIAATGIYVVLQATPNTWLRRDNLIFFSLGAAFLLLETLSVTRLALIFGTTWVVSAVVFTGVLLMILLANYVFQRRPIHNIVWIYGALILSLFVNACISMSAYLSLGVVLRYGLSVFIAALPLFFASMVFSFHVRGRDQLGPILGVNLLGAVTGGVLEYISMLAGLKFLYFVAFLLYAVAYWAYAKPKVTWLRKLYAHPETLDRDSSA